MSGPAGPATGSEPTAALVPVLERARSLGFLGPGPVEDHIEHAGRFGEALDGARIDGGEFADIGSGGGVPGLAVLLTVDDLRAVLIDASQKRCSFLVWASAELGLSDRVDVWCGRAEQIGRESRARERFDAVVARGFGPPARTLECATPLVRPGGLVVVSEPPERRRWPAEGLAELALEEGSGPPGVAVFRRRDGLAARYPRSPKQQQRSPAFEVE